MNWRPALPSDTGAILRLSREPMPGRIQLVWGLSELAAPPGCSDLRIFLAETEGELLATAMSWAWPDGDRYLAGLRFSRAMRGRPGREHWTRGYRDILDGADFAWTSIGRDNLPARRLLERGTAWLPEYRPRLELTTCFLPLPRGRGETPPDELRARGFTPLPHRHAAIAAGRGFSYRIARALRLLPPPGQPLRLLAAAHPLPFRDLRGFDALILVTPASSVPDAPLPALHGAWL